MRYRCEVDKVNRGIEATKRGGSNMKTWLGVLLVALLASPVYATQTQETMIDGETITKASPSVEAERYIGDAEKVTFFITYDSNRTTAAITAKVTAAVSIDGINWQDISWFDVDGGVTPQTSEDLNFSAPPDGTYVMWFDKALTAPQVRIFIKVNNGTALTSSGKAILGPVEAATVSVTVIEKK